MIRLTAIVPATDRPAALPGCLAAIRAADHPPEELLVIEQAPAPGPAAARNVGAARATGEILVFVDSDVEVHRDAFACIRSAFAREPSLTAMFGSYDNAPAARGAVSAFRNLLHHHVHQSAAGPATTFWAGLGAIRRQAFLESGGFDARRFRSASVEDVELGMRLAASGARIELNPALQGTHLKGWTLSAMVRSDLLHRATPWLRMLLARGEHSSALNLGWQHRLSAGVSLGAVAALLARRPAPAAAAVGALVALNHSFYALLWQRRGPHVAAAGVVLHLIHHLTAAAGVPVALAGHLQARRSFADAASHDTPATPHPERQAEVV